MLDLAGAIRRQLKNKTPPPADSAETAETAQPRASAPADDLRITAEVTAEKAPSATFRNFPQTLQNSQTRANTGLQGFIRKSAKSADAAEKKPEPANPDAVLLKVARQLQANPASLRAMMSDDDIQATATGEYTPAYLLEFFKLKQETGELLADQPRPLAPVPAARAPESRPSHIERMKAWKPAHERFMNHLMACPNCYAPRGRYCDIGAEVRRAYVEKCNQNQTKEV